MLKFRHRKKTTVSNVNFNFCITDINRTRRKMRRRWQVIERGG